MPVVWTLPCLCRLALKTYLNTTYSPWLYISVDLPKYNATGKSTDGGITVCDEP